jgi:hypothetical protein
MTSSISYRLLTRNDYLEYFPLINEFRKTEFSEAQFQDYIDTLPSNIYIWVIIMNDSIIGTTTAIYEKKLIFNICTYVHIEDVCILKRFQKGGYGSMIIQHVINQATRDKCYKITLDCNDSVLPFYLKNNFEKRGFQCSMLI